MSSGHLIRLLSDDNLEPFIRAFIDDCQLANLSQKTIDFYQQNLMRFHWWCEGNRVPLDPTTMSPPTIRDFLRYVQSTDERWGWDSAERKHGTATKPASDRTQHAYYRVLRRFFNWLVEQEYIEKSPVDKVRAPRYRKDKPDPFRTEDLERISRALKAPGETMLAERNRAIVALLLDCGLRASECAGIHVKHMNVTTGDLYIEKGKGNKGRQLRVGALARRPVRRYWLRYRKNYDDGPFFLSDDLEGLTGQGIHNLTTKLGERAGVYPCNPHRFRHTMAVSAIRAGMGLLQLQTILGHTSLDMVKEYVKLAEQDVVEAAREHSPLDHLKLSL